MRGRKVKNEGRKGVTYFQSINQTIHFLKHVLELKTYRERLS